jgi:hypothetical protein
LDEFRYLVLSLATSIVAIAFFIAPLSWIELSRFITSFPRFTRRRCVVYTDSREHRHFSKSQYSKFAIRTFSWTSLRLALSKYSNFPGVQIA